MKFNFKKIATVLGSALMLGSTMGIAAAANYAEPFVKGGVGDVAVVVGVAGSLDYETALTITTDLSSKITTAAVTGTPMTISGESKKVERPTDKFNLGDNANTVFVVSVKKDDLPTLLADGKYQDHNNTEYSTTQQIDLGSGLTVTHWSDSDYKDKVPTVGTKLTTGTLVANYTYDFTPDPPFTNDLETSTLKLMGKEYYVLDVISNGITLLDTASTSTITEGETTSITVGAKTFQVGINFIDSTTTKLVIDGTTTTSLSEGSTYKLSSGDYLAVKDIMYNSKDSGISKVEISIGSGKLELVNGVDIEVNDNTVTGLRGYLFNSSATLNKIVLEWKTDGEQFITTDKELVMPAFKAIKFTQVGMTYPTEEVTRVDVHSDYVDLRVPIKDGSATIPLLYYSTTTGNFSGIGKDSSNRLITANATQIVYNTTRGDKWFVASWNSSTDAQTYLLSATINTKDNANRTTIKNEVTGNNACSDLIVGGTCSLGNVILTVENVTVYSSGDKFAVFNISSGGTFNNVYTASGMRIYLPYNATISSANYGAISLENGSAANPGHSDNSWYLFVAEEDKDSKLGLGRTFNMTLDATSLLKPTVSAVDTGTGDTTVGLEIDDTDDYEFFVQSDLATRVLYKTGGDQDYTEITYHGDQSYAGFYIAAPSATSTGSGSSSAVQPVYDNAVSSVLSKNLIVVGGSCVNTVAAKLIGSNTPICGSAWTSITGVSAGQFIIQSFDASAAGGTAGKVALLVAGYEKADTDKAATFLKNKVVNTAIGKKKVVASATEAIISEA
jgi:hypothetical protein